MQFKISAILLPVLLIMVLSKPLTAGTAPIKYIQHNHGIVSFDISMPVDSTGYLLHGKNLKGGNLQFINQGAYIAPLLAYEKGIIHLPVSMTDSNKPLINTNIKYNAIKFINPNGISNLFIKVGTAIRTQKVSGLDPTVLKDGTYTWQVPIFSVGKESDTVKKKSENLQFMEVGSIDDPSHHNEMYTQAFHLYLQGSSDSMIVGHPISVSLEPAILKNSYMDRTSCHADGLWGAGGDDPYHTITGSCSGSTHTYPAGPNLDYVYGTFKFPTVHSPWTATKNDYCKVNGKYQSGCVNITINSDMRFIAQKIRMPIKSGVSIFAESGTVYRTLTPKNFRYVCKSNVYLKGILPKKDCLKKNYLPGGWSAPFFAVGFEFNTYKGKRYSAQFIYIPAKENASKLAWNDASDTQIYATSVSDKRGANNKAASLKEIRKNFNKALNIIRKNPSIYKVIGKPFFEQILKKNGLYDPVVKKISKHHPSFSR